MTSRNRSKIPSFSRLKALFCVIVVILGFVIVSPGATWAQSGGSNRIFLPVIMASASQVSYPSAPDWLAYVNRFRSQANLPPLTDNPQWSDGNWNHARYMVKNDVIAHEEDSNNPWYTPEGDAAARNSNLMVSTSFNSTYAQAIDLWMEGPFHALGILDPQLLQTGFGIYHEDVGSYRTGAGLDVLRGLGSIPAGITFPVIWPGDGQVTHLYRYGGSESPNPLSACGYIAPTGLPILLQIGDGEQTPKVTASRLEYQGQTLDHCRFDETTYTNPDPDAQALGRSILNARDAIVLVPRSPLQAGKYVASVTVNGQTYRWTFSIQPAVGASNAEQSRDPGNAPAMP